MLQYWHTGLSTDHLSNQVLLTGAILHSSIFLDNTINQGPNYMT